MKQSKSSASAYTVYQFSINSEVLYFGRTNDPVRRLKEHQSICYSPNHASHNKTFYKHWRILYPEKQSGVEALKIAFKEVRVFKKLVDSKRFELYCILSNYFNGWTLKQRIPNISDKF